MKKALIALALIALVLISGCFGEPTIKIPQKAKFPMSKVTPTMEPIWIHNENELVDYQEKIELFYGDCNKTEFCHMDYSIKWGVLLTETGEEEDTCPFWAFYPGADVSDDMIDFFKVKDKEYGYSFEWWTERFDYNSDVEVTRRILYYCSNKHNDWRDIG